MSMTTTSYIAQASFYNFFSFKLAHRKRDVGLLCQITNSKKKNHFAKMREGRLLDYE